MSSSRDAKTIHSIPTLWVFSRTGQDGFIGAAMGRRVVVVVVPSRSDVCISSMAFAFCMGHSVA